MTVEKPKRAESFREKYKSIIYPVLYGLANYVFLAVVFNSQWLDESGSIGTILILLIPFILGVIVAYVNYGSGWFQAVRKSIVPSILTVLTMGVLGRELIICALILMPFYILIAAVGASFGHVIFKFVLSTPEKKKKRVYSFWAIAFIIPYLILPFRPVMQPPTALSTVSREVIIEATPQEVWESIIRVAEIQPDEQSTSIFHLIGIPRPQVATLQGEGLGAVRQGSFEAGIVFTETITIWEEYETVAFTIDIATDEALPLQYRALGSEQFDVLSAEYRIIPLDENTVRLRLSTSYELSTFSNSYGQLWLNWIVGDFEEYLLDILQARLEQ